MNSRDLKLSEKGEWIILEDGEYLPIESSSDENQAKFAEYKGKVKSKLKNRKIDKKRKAGIKSASDKKDARDNKAISEFQQRCVQFWDKGVCSRGEACPYEHVARPLPVCRERQQDGVCKRFSKGKPCVDQKTGKAWAHPEQPKKPEHLVPGKPVISVPYRYEIIVEDRTGTKSRCNVWVACDKIQVPRHAASGAKKISMIVKGVEHVLKDTAYVPKNGYDQLWFPIPSGCSPTQNTKFTYRAPVIGEEVTLCWISQGVECMTTGPVGKKLFMGKDRDIVGYEYLSSTKAGACGAAYKALKDNAIVGFHGIGNDDPRVNPQFYPVSLSWSEEFKNTQQNSCNFKYGENGDWFTQHTENINIEYWPVADSSSTSKNL